MRDGHSPTDFLSDTNSRLQAERSRKVPSVRFLTVRTLGAALIRYMYYLFSEGCLVFAGTAGSASGGSSAINALHHMFSPK